MFTPTSCLSFTLGRRRRKPIIQRAQLTRTRTASTVTVSEHIKTAKSDDSAPFNRSVHRPNGMSLDQYLKSFLETLWWQEAKVSAGDDVFQKEFDSLRRQSTPAGEKNATEALKPVNRPKNRYKDIVPFDYARVSTSGLSTFSAILNYEKKNYYYIYQA